jgi:hypothetical protein
VKFFTRGLVLFTLSSGLLVMVGCGTDNETEAEKLAKTAGSPGEANPKGIPKSTPPVPTSEAERGKQFQESQKTPPEGYPGAKKK